MRLLPALLLTSVMSSSASAQTYTISTFAGGALPVNMPGTSASLDVNVPQFVAADQAGNVFFVDQNAILRLDATTGVVTLVAGNGTPGFSGDGGPPTTAQLNGPSGVAVDSAGNLYIADTNNQSIREVSNGVISTVAGNQTPGFSGDNGSATSAQLNRPWGVAVDSAGDLYIADAMNQCIREVSNGVISTVAGTGTHGFSGDNGPATSAQLDNPYGVAVDSAGSLYIADSSNSRIRKVSGGVITTIAGNGTPGFSGDNGPAASARLAYPQGVAVDSASNLYIADAGNNRIRKVSNGVIATVAGGGAFLGDNGPATSAQLDNPEGVAVDSAANLYIADTSNSRIRKVSNAVISTVAGNGTVGFSGDNGPPTSAQLANPWAVAVDSAGNLYIADYGNNRVREVSNGVIATVAGNGTRGFSGDNGPATSAQFYDPAGLAVDSAGNLYIADYGNNRIRKVSNGLITTVAGGGAALGDNGPATSAKLADPYGVAVDAAGNLYVADWGNNRIRMVSNGVITTVAGTGTRGFSGDNGPATSAQLANPQGVAVDSAGNLYIADFGNSRVREVSNGVITTVAGNGAPGFSGDNGPATSAQLANPYGVAIDAAGNLYIGDSGNNRVREVSNGSIATIAGNGIFGFSGDNGPPASAQLANPYGVAIDFAGNLYIGDSGNSRIRVLTPFSPCTYSVSPTTLETPASGGNLTVAIQTGASCSWTVSGLPGWIAVSSPSSGVGSSTVTLVVGPNPGLSVSATIVIAGVSVTITLSQAAAETAQLPVINAVVNAASYIGGPVSPGELVTIFGTAIGPVTAAYPSIVPSTGKLATTIGGVEVLFNGIPAPMIYASSGQVSAVVPYEMAPSPSVWIVYAGGTSSAYQLNSVATAPGLFTRNSSGSGPGAILNQDNSTNGPNNPAAKGSVVQVYLTGEGQTSPPSITGAITIASLPPPQVTPAPALPITILINRQSAFYKFAGEAPGLVAGMMQLNVQIPSNAQSGNLPITVQIGANISQSGVTVSVQ
ncbi:MAG: hypothetical protein ABSG79_01205 [Bryobacteraceae bacterium]|jgi:uncharacterized protein (TIGR03437 family)